ncbi:hypothetical protein HY628_01725 [Candidatus Uhrbacteria bacterium]|nr:hypothetical protein [Candidatus Uhrbacteria bacterium]
MKKPVDLERLEKFFQEWGWAGRMRPADLKELAEIMGLGHGEELVEMGSRRAKKAFLKPRDMLALGYGEMLIREAAALLRMTAGGVRAAGRRGSIIIRQLLPKGRGRGRKGLLAVDAASLRAYMERTGRRVPPKRPLAS